MPPEATPISTGEIEFRQYEGASSRGLGFVDILERMYDRWSIRGAKANPSLLGSNEFTAESSAEEQMIQYSTRISSHQDTVERIIKRLLTFVIRGEGIAGEVNFSTRRINSKERKREAETFDIIMGGILKAYNSGIPLKLAILIYQDTTGFKLSDDLIREIEDAVIQEGLGSENTEGDDNGTDGDDGETGSDETA